jgi:hypothetical protein
MGREPQNGFGEMKRTSKFQIPNPRKASITKRKSGAGVGRFGISNLIIVWMLVVGVWDFFSSFVYSLVSC